MCDILQNNYNVMQKIIHFIFQPPNNVEIKV
jgi:hypothetical protein